MGGLNYQTSQWADKLWIDHVRVSKSAARLSRDGAKKQQRYLGHSQDVHSLLYLRHPPERRTKPAPPAWATTLLEQARELPEWEALRARCRLNGFAAGLATETVLAGLMSQLPEQAPQEKKHRRSGVEQNQEPPHPSKGTNQGGDPKNGQQPGKDPQGTDQSNGDQDAALRKALRQACRDASAAVDEAEAAVEGMGEALGSTAGHGLGEPQSLQDLSAIRALYELLRHNTMLQRIALLAGRLSRICASHKRSRVTPAEGGIKDVVLGGDLAKILPGELAGLRSRHRLLRLSTLQKVMSRQALQYLTQGTAPETRGPIICALDESDSMNDHDGMPRDWSKAVAMALLTTATQQKRACHILGFTEFVTHEQTILPGELHLEVLTDALLRQCDGGTSFNAPLRRMMEILRTAPTMHKADFVFVTDGAAVIAPEVMAEMQALKHETSAHLYVLGIGPAAQQHIHLIAPIADEIYLVAARADEDSERIAPVIALAS